MGGPEQPLPQKTKTTSPRSERSAEVHAGPVGPGLDGPTDYDLANMYIGAIRPRVNAGKPQREGVTALLTEITPAHVKIKRECSLAIASLKPPNMAGARAALQSLDPWENQVSASTGEVRMRRLRLARQARSPEDIQKLHSALKTAGIVR